jgi:hypothetical protein
MICRVQVPMSARAVAFPYPMARADYPLNKYPDTPEAAHGAVY